MVRRPYTALLIPMLLLGCAKAQPLVPTDPAPIVRAPLSDAAGSILCAPAVYDLTLDLSTLSATVAPEEPRSGTGNGALYELSIGNFLRSDSFQVEKIGRTTSALQMTYRVRHPMAPPSDPAGLPGATNRADLGITGIVCFLVDRGRAPYRFFTDRLVNTSTFMNPDGYYSPAGLLTISQNYTNTYPFQSIVSERGATGSRPGISNGGKPTGNYGTDGWTRAKLGTNHTGWTGYGVLHQGQTSRRTINIRLADLGPERYPVRIQVALIVRYADPRGGSTGLEKRSNRLPPATPDSLKFAYREPHGAWDLPRVTYEGESGGFVAGTASSSTLRFHVEDWDIGATPTTFEDLSLDPDPTHVAPAEPGLPALDLCIPDLLGDATVAVPWNPASTRVDDDALYGGDPEPDSGLPGDAILFAKRIDMPSTVTRPGTYTGLLRVSDPEVSAVGLVTALTAQLTPVTAYPALPITYQICTVTVAPNPTAQGWARKAGDDFGTAISSVLVSSGGTSFVSGYYWDAANFGGGVRAYDGGGVDSFVASFDTQGAWKWDREFECAGFDFAGTVVFDEAGKLWVVGAFDTSIDLGVGPQASAGDLDVYVIEFDQQGKRLASFVTGGPAAEYPTAFVVDSSGQLVMGGVVEYPTPGSCHLFGNDIPATSQDSWLVRGAPDGTTASWTKLISGVDNAALSSLALDSQDNPVICGSFLEGIVIDGHSFGPLSAGNNRMVDAWAAKFTQAGIWQWGKVWGAVESSHTTTTASQLVIGAQDQVDLTGTSEGTVDFGGGSRPLALGIHHQYALAVDADGTWLWDTSWPNTQGLGILTRGNGDLLLAGSYAQAIDFGGGLRPITKPGLDGMSLIALSSAGAYRWDQTWGDSSNCFAMRAGEAADGTLRIVGYFGGTCDFDPGVGVYPLTAADFQTEGFLMRLSPDGGF